MVHSSFPFTIIWLEREWEELNVKKVTEDVKILIYCEMESNRRTK